MRPKYLDFALIAHYYISPIDSLLSMFEGEREYEKYEEYTKLFIEEYFLCNGQENILDKLYNNWAQYIPTLNSYLLKYADEEIKSGNLAKEKFFDIKPQLINKELTHLEKFNLISNVLELDYKILTQEEIKSIPQTNEKYIDSTPIEPFHKALTYFQEYFIKIYNKLVELEHEKCIQCGKLIDKELDNLNTILAISSVEFFYAMNHLSAALTISWSNNINQAIGHLNRSIIDMQKGIHFNQNLVSLETIKSRIFEIKNIGNSTLPVIQRYNELPK